MNLTDLKYPIVLVLISMALGYSVTLFIEVRWFSATFIVISILVMLGTWTFEDDALPGGQSHDAEQWNSGERKVSLLNNNTMNYLAILCLWLVAVIIEAGT